MSDFSTWLGSNNGIAVACLAGLVVAVLLVWFIHWRTSARAWAGDEANAVIGLGMPPWFAAPLLKASQGDKAGALQAFKTFASNVTSSAGVAEMDAGYITKAKSDPARWARWKQIIADVDSGATFDQIKTEIKSAVEASPLAGFKAPPTMNSVAHADIQAAVQHVQSAIATAKSTGENALNHVHDMLNATGNGHLFPLVAAGVQAQAVTAGTVAGGPAGGAAALAASQAANDIAAKVSAALASSTQPAPAANQTSTPAAPAPGLALTATGLLDGHNIAVTATPGTPAALAGAATQAA